MNISATAVRQAVRGMVVIATFLGLSGCVVRSYDVAKDRVDQELSSGNRGYLMGTAPAIDESNRDLTRDNRVVEVELHSPFKWFRHSGKKSVAVKKTKKRAAAAAVQVEGNKGYITQNAPMNIVEETVPVPAASVQQYTVQEGDTLQKISQKFFGTTRKWQTIFEANKETLKGPNKIYPGQVIAVPVDPLKETSDNLK